MLFRGFESWREVLEVKPILEPMTPGKPFDYGQVHTVKGTGRLSMIFWAVVHTYTHLRDKMTAEEKVDFARLLGVQRYFRTISKSPKNIKVSRWRLPKPTTPQRDGPGGSVVLEGGRAISHNTFP